MQIGDDYGILLNVDSTMQLSNEGIPVQDDVCVWASANRGCLWLERKALIPMLPGNDSELTVHRQFPGGY
jgi:hypothetical protein